MASFRAATSGNVADGTYSVAKPAGTIDGDLLLVSFTHASSGVTFSAPDGTWTKVTGAETGGSQASHSLFYKVASSEPSSWVFSSTDTDNQCAFNCVAVQDVDAVDPIDVISVHTPSGTQLDMSATTTVAGCLLVATMGFDAASAQTFTPDEGMTERVGETVTDTFLVQYVFTEEVTTAQQYDRGFAKSGGGSQIWGVLIGVAPSTGGAVVEGTAASNIASSQTGLGVRRVVGTAASAVGTTQTATSITRKVATAVSTISSVQLVQGTTRKVATAVSVVSSVQTAQGVRRAVGTAASAVNSTQTVQAIRRIIGTAANVVASSQTVQGIRRVLGSAESAISSTQTASGETVGQATGSATSVIASTQVATGVRRVNGTAASTIATTQTASGVIVTDVITGTATSSIGSAQTASGIVRKVGQGVSVVASTQVASSLRRVFGVATSTIATTQVSSGAQHDDSVSSVGLAQDALMTLLAEELDSDTGISLGMPVSRVHKKFVALLGFEELTESFAGLGRSANREEEYSLRVLITYFSEAAKGDAGHRIIRDGCMDIYNQLRYVVGANPTLSGVVYQAEVSSADSEGVLPIQGGGFGMDILVNVHCKARISPLSP